MLLCTYNDFISQNDATNGLLESLSSARKRFIDSNKISNDVFVELLNADPTKQKKYIEKLCAFYLEIADVNELSRLIQIYDTLATRKIIKKTDINQFKNFFMFKTEIDTNQDKQTKTQSQRNVKNNDADVIVDDDDFFIVSPKTHGAACFYGYGTKWCISMKDNDWHWAMYAKKLIKFYFILNKKLSDKNSMYKIAVSVYPSGDYECTNAKDEPIDFEDVLDLGIREDIFKTADVSLEMRISTWIKGKYEIDDNGLYNVKGDVKVINFKGEILPIRFDVVSGNFVCSDVGLTSFAGCPNVVGRNFNCSNNAFNSLEYAPSKVRCDFICKDNKFKMSEDDIHKHVKISGKLIM